MQTRIDKTNKEAIEHLKYPSGSRERDIRYLEKRVRYLEEVYRFTMDALEMAASLGDFQTSINNHEDIPAVLAETGSRIRRLMPLKTVSFFLVEEDTHDFLLTDVDPPDERTRIQKDVDFLIEDGTFAWALRENRPVMVSARNHESQLILHVMATNSRIRGMFVGVLERDESDVPDLPLSLLSIILLNSANAIENLELYRLIRMISDNLRKKENYKNLFEAAPDGVEVLDARGNVVDCNEAHLKLLGRIREDIIGNHTSDFFSDPCKTLFEENAAVLKGEGYVESEVELVSGDGAPIPVWRKEKAILDEDNVFVGSVVYNRDISKLKQVEQEKRHLEIRLRRAQNMEALGTLAGGVAHDLNNVLSGLVSYPELILMQIPEDSPLRKPILIVKKSGEKAAAIVQDLLTLGRRGVPVSEVVNLNHIIEEYFNTPEFELLKAFHPNVRFVTRLDGDLLNIKGSPVHLSKTVMNLISNAAEAVPSKGEVVISTENRYLDRPVRGYEHVDEGDYVVLTVSDTGIGISDEDLERIFEPFYTKKVMGRSGTGLGMTVVWGTVKDHDGYIDVKSSQGAGTRMRLYFKVTGEGPARGEKSIPVDTYRGNGETVLVVDDVEEQRHIATQILEALGYSVTTVAGGEEAVRYLESHSVDLIVLDMIMDPGIDGLETYKRILRIHQAQKVLIVSGYSETDRIKEAQRLGAGQYVKKPYTLEKMGTALKNELCRQHINPSIPV